MVEAKTQRIVPGAPSPVPLSKSQQKKKRKSGKTESTADSPITVQDFVSAAFIEKAPDSPDAREGSLATEPIVHPGSQTPLVDDDLLLKLSPIVDLIHKRLKVTTKKIVRLNLHFLLTITTDMLYLDTDINICIDRS